MSISRIHLVESPTRITEGTDVLADCGSEIPHAAFVMATENGIVTKHTPPEFTTMFCRECMNKTTGRRETTYLYFVVPGQESIDV